MTTTSSWRQFSGNDLEWNVLVKDIGNSNVYQSAEWATHKQSNGWRTLRLVFSPDDLYIRGSAQCMYRVGPLGVVVVWVPGGPGGDIDSVNLDFHFLLKKVLNARFIYLRCSPMIQTSAKSITNLTQCNWKRSTSVIGTNSSMTYPLSADQETRISWCSPNWKRNLRRSARNSSIPYIWKNPNAAEISAAYDLMDGYKKVHGVSLARPVADLLSVINAFGDKLILLRTDDSNGSPLAIRGALVFGNIAWDFIAITTPAGRKTYASHATFWSLTETCYQGGLTALDLGGIDPVNNRGVYDFKKGTGATQIEYVGEWEIASPRWIRPLASKIIRRKLS